MRILITTDCYCPIINGVVTAVVNLKNELERQGHEVLLLTLSQSTKTYQEGNVIYIGSLKADRVYPNMRIRLLIDKKWIRKIIDWKPEIVHSHCEFSTFTLAKRISRQLGIPLVHTYHTIYEDYTHYVFPDEWLGRKAARGFTKIVCNSTDMVIAPTEKIAGLLRDYGVNCGISVIPSGLCLKKYHSCKPVSRQDFNIPADETVLIYLGRLAREKNLEEIITFLRSYEGKPLTLLIVGDGPYRQILQTQSETMPENVRVCFTGMVPQECTQDYYRLGDLFVSASQSETQGLTYIEAAACGLPLLCREDDCLRTVISQGDNGWQYTSEQEFLDRLQQFMGLDYIRRNEMGLCSRKKAAQYDITRTVGLTVDLYKAAICHKSVKQQEASYGNH